MLSQIKKPNLKRFGLMCQLVFFYPAYYLNKNLTRHKLNNTLLYLSIIYILKGSSLSLFESVKFI